MRQAQLGHRDVVVLLLDAGALVNMIDKVSHQFARCASNHLQTFTYSPLELHRSNISRVYLILAGMDH